MKTRSAPVLMALVTGISSNIVLQLAQRIPELEARQESTPETRDDPERASEGTDRSAVPSEQQEPAQRRPWLYRFFFGP
jgi:hypothetical protein